MNDEAKRMVVEAILTRHLAARNIDHPDAVATQLVAKWHPSRLSLFHVLAMRRGAWTTARELASMCGLTFMAARSAWKQLAAIEIEVNGNAVRVFRRGVELRYSLPVDLDGERHNGGVQLCLAGQKRMTWGEETKITRSTQTSVETANANYNESVSRQLGHPEKPAGVDATIREDHARATGSTRGTQLRLVVNTGTDGRE